MNVQDTHHSKAPDHPETGGRAPGTNHRGPEPRLRLHAGGAGSGGGGGRGRFTLAFGDERRSCVIVAGGPTAAGFCTADFAGLPIIAVNDAYRLHPSAQALYGADGAWWRHHIEAINASGFAGRCFCADADTASALGLEHRRVALTKGLSRDHDVLNAGGTAGNSGAQAINLAFLGGARKLILIGFDMGGHGAREHWFGAHPKPLRNDSPYQLFVAGMGKMAMDLADERVHVLNGSPKSGLLYWPRLEPDQVRAVCALSP